MNTHKLRILYVLEKNKIRQGGKAPIYCRLTFLKKRKQFATGLFIKPDHWSSKRQKTHPPDKNNNYVNTQLSLISQKINEAFLFLQVSSAVFDVEDIYLQYKGESIKKNKTLLEVFSEHNEQMQRLVGVDYAKSTYSKFIEVNKHTVNFIKHKYGKRDILLESLPNDFLQEFDFYLKSEFKHKQITVNKSIQRLRKIIKLAVAKGYLDKDPFILYKPKPYKTEIVFLNKAELNNLEQFQFAQLRLSQVRDMFIFCCYTGLAYAEMKSLSEKHLVKGFDGKTWIKMYRKKTGSMVSLPLLAKPEKIIKKYKTDKELLPVISNQKFNSYLKEIAEVVGISKKLTHHVARKTFATTILLFNKVPMEIVSELLGHSRIGITQQHYAKIVQKSVSDEMKKLAKRINN